MPLEIKMPALSPTMEEGTLARWLVKEGDTVRSGDLLAEIETDKATMEFEAVDEGVVARILVSEGSEGVGVGSVIAVLAFAGEDMEAVRTGSAGALTPAAVTADTPVAVGPADEVVAPSGQPAGHTGDRIKASPLARRLAAKKGIDLKGISGTGPGGRIVRVDLESVSSATAAPAASGAMAPSADQATVQPFVTDIPHSVDKLSNMRKTIARRLTEAKQTIPHIYLTLDVELDMLLKLRGELNAAVEPQGIKLSVNDLLIKALAKALIQVPQCNVSYAGDQLVRYSRADISVAVSVPAGLITPIIVGADGKSVSTISTDMKELAARARDGKLQPHEYQGGTASLSNMGMFGIKQFEAVINPPQGMIMAIGAGEKRPWIVDDAVGAATIMSATGSFDHRAIDGADGAQLMQAFKHIVENPLGLVA